MSAKEIVSAHLRAVENGDWDTAQSYIAPNYEAKGGIPFPISLFVKIKADGALTMHKARKKALPDFKFNEKYLMEKPDMVRIEVNITGTHTGTIDYRGIIRGVPVVEPTGKFVTLNPEYFEYYVQNDKIVLVKIEIPKNAGVKGLVRAVRG